MQAKGSEAVFQDRWCENLGASNTWWERAFFFPFVLSHSEVGPSYWFDIVGVWQLVDTRCYSREGHVLLRRAMTDSTAQRQRQQPRMSYIAW